MVRKLPSRSPGYTQEPYDDKYERQARQRYTGDPREKTQQKGLSGSLGTLGKQILAVGAGIAGIQAARKGIKKLPLEDIGKKLVSSLDDHPLVKNIAKGGIKGTKWVKQLQEGVENKFRSSAGTEVKLYENWKKSWDQKEKALFKKSNKLPRFDRLDDLAKKKSNFYFDKLDDFLKPKNFNERLKGKMVKTGRHYVQGGVDLYAASSLFGLNVYNSNNQKDDIPITDIPGRASHFAGSLKKYTRAHFMLRSIKPGFRMGKSVTGKAILGTANKTLPDRGGFASKFLKKASENVVPKIGKFMTGFSHSWHALSRSGVSNVAKYPDRSMKKAKHAWNRAVQGRKDFPKDFSPVESLRHITDEINKADESSVDIIRHFRNTTEGRRRGLRILRDRKGAHPRMRTFFEKLTKLKRYKIQKEDMDFVIDGLKDDTAKEEMRTLLSSLKAQDVPLADFGVFKNQRDEVVDLRNLSPKRMAKRSLRFLEQINIPGTSIYPASLFGIKRITADQPVIKKFEPGTDIPVGTSIDRNNITKWRGNAKAAAEATRHIVPKKHGGIEGLGSPSPGVYRVPDAEKGFGYYIAGNVFHVNAKEQGDQAITRLAPTGSDFSLRLFGRNDAYDTILKNRAGIESMRGHFEKFEKNTSSFFGGILKKLDISRPGENWPFGRFHAAVRKYLVDDSPLKMDELKRKAIATGSDPPAKDAYLKNLQRVIRKNRGASSKIIRDHPDLIRFVTGGNVEPQMASDELVDNIKNLSMEAPKGKAGKYERLLKRYEIKSLMENMDDSMDRGQMTRVVRSLGRHSDMTAHDETLEFLFAEHSLKKFDRAGLISKINEFNRQAHPSSTLDDSELAHMKLWAQDLFPDKVFNQIGDNPSRDAVEELAYRIGDENLDQTVKNLYKTFTPLDERPGIFQERTAYAKSGKGKLSQYTLLPERGTRMEFPDMNQDPNKLKEIMEKLDSGLSGDDFSYIMRQTDNLVKNTVSQRDLFAQRVAGRFEGLLSFWGLGLDYSRYDSAAEFIGQGIGMKRILPVVGAVAGGWAADKAVDANPIFDGTALDEGIITAGAEQVAKGRLMLQKAYDVTGVTSAAKYASGLMPGTVNSPLARAGRGVFGPILAGAHIGGHLGGPTGAGYGMLAGAGLGVTQGFGLFDITKDEEELKDIYSGRQKVPIKKGRGWLLSSTNFEGGQVQQWRPNWFARIKAKAKDTPEGFGSPTEQLIYRDLPMLDFNPVGNVLDPHHYATRRQYSQPFPECVDKDTLIQTDSKIKKANNIEIGDKVFTHNGKYREVLDILRKYHESAYEIKLYSYYDSFIVSDIHPFLSIKTKECYYTRNDKYKKKCLPCTKTQYCNNCDFKNYYESEWIEMEKLEEGDFVAYPRQKLKNNINYINISDYIENNKKRNYVVNDDFLELKHWYDKKYCGSYRITEECKEIINRQKKKLDFNLYELSSMIGYNNYQSLSDVINQKTGISKNKYFKLLEILNIVDNDKYRKNPVTKGLKSSSANKVKNTIKLDFDFGFLCGVYLAEGSLGKKQGYNTSINFSHNEITEIEIYKKVKLVFKDKFGLDPYVRNEDDDNGLELTFSSSIIADFIDSFLGNNSYNKNLNFDYYNFDIKFLLGLLNGYIVSDGGSSSDCINVTSVNLDLLVNIKNLLLSFGVVSSLTERTDHGYRLYIYGSDTQKFYNMIKLKDKFSKLKDKDIRKRFRSFIDEDYVYFRIENIDRIENYSDYMIDFTIDDSHSFCTINAALHNTSVPFEDFPIAGPTMAGTVGRLIESPKKIRQDEVESMIGMSSSAPYTRKVPSNRTGGGPGGKGMFNEDRAYSDPIHEADYVSDAHARRMFDEQWYNMEKAMGLWGFGASRMGMENLTGKRTPFEADRVLATSGELDSFRRAYWDEQLGDVAGLTEAFRRLAPQERYKRKSNRFNPLLNSQPSWMPERFHVGAPVSSVPNAEERMPGRGYETLNDVEHTFPATGEMLGLSTPDMVRKMLNLYPKSRESPGSNIYRQNKEREAAGIVYDPNYNVSGSLDGEIRLGRREVAKKIKTLTSNELEEFNKTKEQNKSEMNFLLRQTGKPAGLIQYQYQGKPVATQPVKYSERRWERDVIRLSKARKIAQDLYRRGLGFGSEGYSHKDRLEVLADTAPSSEEYYKELSIVRLQNQAGYDLDEDIKKAQRMRKFRLQKKELYPYRFKDKVFSPDPEFNNLSLNENIKAASEYTLTERVIGSGWERLSHLSTPIHSKFMHYRSPREAYERGELYGKDMKMWCISSNENIITKQGIKKASEISIGDYVVTLDGGWNKIKDVIINDISDIDDEMYSIDVNGVYLPKQVTGNHSVYALKSSECVKDGDKGRMCFGPCDSWCAEENRKYKNYKNEWIKVNDLEENDYLVTPLPDFDDYNKKKIDISKYINMGMNKIKNNNIIACQHLFGRKELSKAPTSKKIPRYIECDEDFYKLLGWYLAEGYPKADSGVAFAFNEDEKDYIKEVNDLMIEIFGIEGSLEKNKKYNDHGVYIIFRSRLLEEFFRSYLLCGAENKHIPDRLMFTSKNNRREMLIRYFNGDGYYSDDGILSATSSEKLSLQLYLQLLSLEIKSSISYKPKPDKKLFKFKGKEMLIQPEASFWNSVSRRGKQKLLGNDVTGWELKQFFIKDGYLYSKIKSIDKVDYNDVVYDFTVENIQSYSGLGVCFHNSNPIDDYMNEYRKGFMSKTTPFQGSLAGAIAGTIVGGPGLGTAAGGSAGAIYGGIHGVYREITGSTYIPGDVKESRKINRYFDDLDYKKNMMLYETTGDPTYKDAADATMSGLKASSIDKSSWSDIYRATPAQEKDYIFPFLSVNDPNERNKILQKVPPEVSDVLAKKWSKMDNQKPAVAQSQAQTKIPSAPPQDWAGWSPYNRLKDIKYKTIEKEGLNAHDFGLGWCVIPSQILTDKYGNEKKAEDIVIGDKLINKDGENDSVNDIYKRKGYNDNLVTLEIEGESVHDISATENHDVLAVKCDNVCKDNERINCHIGRNREYCNECRLKDEYSPRFFKIGDLTPNQDFLAVPVIKYKKEDKLMLSDVIDLEEYKFIDIKPYKKKMVVFGKDCGEKMIYSKPRKNKNFIEDLNLYNEKLFKLFGYWLAEGNIIHRKNRTPDNYGIQFSLNLNEIEYRDDIVNIVDNLFSLNANYYNRKDRNTCEVQVASEILADLFYNLFGEYAWNKKINKKLFHAPDKCLKSLLIGYFNGDGYYYQSRKDIKSVKSSSTSKKLSMQLLLILRSLGIKAKIYKSYPKNRRKKWAVDVYGKEFSKLINLKNKPEYIYYKITDKIIDNYKGELYDFSMDKIPSYSSYFIVFHNSRQMNIIESNNQIPEAINMDDPEGSGSSQVLQRSQKRQTRQELRRSIELLLDRAGVQGRVSVRENNTTGNTLKVVNN